MSYDDELWEFCVPQEEDEFEDEEEDEFEVGRIEWRKEWFAYLEENGVYD